MGTNGAEVKFYEFISFKKEESEQDDNHSFMELVKKEEVEKDDSHPFMELVQKEEDEQDDNHPFMESVKKKEGDIGDGFSEDKPSTFSIVKLEPESNAFEFEHFSRNMNRKDISDSTTMDLNRSNYFSVEPTQSDVKVENTTKTYEIKKSDEIMVQQWRIKNEEVEIRTEDLEQSQNSMLVTFFGNEKHKDLLNKEQNQFGEQERKEKSLQMQLTHQIKPSKEFKCSYCNYETFYESNLIRHIYYCVIRHKNPEYMFKCNQCDYQTHFKSSLKRHALRHKNIDDKMFKCNHCDYQTHRKSYLKRHVLRHKITEDIKMFKCDHCDYQTYPKRYLKKHSLRHKNSEDIKMFKCDHCDYQTRLKCRLKRHALRHKNPEDVEMFKCDYCDYQTRYKDVLRKHSARHKNQKKVEMYKCDQCDFKTRQKGFLKSHYRRHKNSIVSVF